VRDYTYQIKLVVDRPADCELVEAYLRAMPEIDRSRVMLMPQGTDQRSLERQAQWLEPYCRAHGLHYCPRKHIEWYGLVRGT
jgi:7-carboxy-7-deazaguanine synthase